jgi:hypothetical protein
MVLALLGVLFAEGQYRKFSAWFVLTTVAFIGGLMGAALAAPNSDLLFLSYMNGALQRTTPTLTWLVGPSVAGPKGTGGRNAVFFFFFSEAALSLPIVGVAVAGGLLSLMFRGRNRTRVG